MHSTEKEKELMDKFDIVDSYGISSEGQKKCSLIVVNEIVSSLQVTTGWIDLTKNEQIELQNDFQYWEDVKTEINKL